MAPRPIVLCPVDFSDSSAGALRYAAAIADHFRAELVVVTVEDPLLTEARDLGMGIVYAVEDSCRELTAFARPALRDRDRSALTPTYDVAVGRPADEIRRLATERGCDLIVMSSHGLTGVRKLFFGSTTERLLRSTTVPVLVTPADDRGPASLEDAAGTIGRILLPVDLASDPSRQVEIASAVASALGLPMLIAHVIEPIRAPFYARAVVSAVETERRLRAGERLRRLAGAIAHTPCEAVVVAGDPSEEIATLARERGAGLIVAGLHTSPLLGPRMGSVTYRTLCRVESLVLAIPPVPAAARAMARDATVPECARGTVTGEPSGACAIA